MFVLDASVTLAFCFADEADDVADATLARLEKDDAVAPAIWPLEVANGLRTAVHRGRLRPDELPRLRALLTGLRVEIEPVDLPAALGETLDLALTRELTAYDAAYLALALRRGLALATADDRLRRACRQAGVTTIG